MGIQCARDLLEQSAIDWRPLFKVEDSHIQVVGRCAASEEQCRHFFKHRVSARLAQSDAVETLRQHLIELRSPDAGLAALATQIERTPTAKQWEIGEAIAEIVLEDLHGADFPWQTGLDKRTSTASLSGADLVGLQNHEHPRFVFGEVKSTSEQRSPPSVVNSGEHCLRSQMHRLLHISESQAELIGWLRSRLADAEGMAKFNRALKEFAYGKFWLVGVLVSGKRTPNQSDLVGICAGIGKQPQMGGEVSLLGFYLPFKMEEWPELAWGRQESL